MSLAMQETPVTSWIAEPSLGSDTPSLNLLGLPGLALGRLSSIKCLSSSVSCDSLTALICSRALAAEPKGLKAVSLHVLPNLEMSLMDE